MVFLATPMRLYTKPKSKSLTLGEGDFDYRRLTDLLLSGDWRLPVLARPATLIGETLTLVCSALVARQQQNGRVQDAQRAR